MPAWGTGSADNAHFKIAVLPGDGIGHEVMAPCLELLDGLGTKHGFKLSFKTLDAGAELYRRTGEALPADVLNAADDSDAILLGAMGHPDIRYPDGREIAPQVDLREHFCLYAGVRPIRTSQGMTVPLADPRARDLDLVIIRESTEGMFAGRNDAVVDHESARSVMTITRAASEKLFDFAFDLARQRKAQGSRGMVTCVDKANVFAAFGFFRDIFNERALLNPDIETDTCYVDAMALNLVRRPWDYDVIVTENLFGDILSDLGAGLMGGMGMAPSADIGAKHAVFQPCHGTAPDIAGQGKANPTAMILSAALMLDWLGRGHDVPGCVAAGAALDSAVMAAFRDGRLLPFEIGGSDGTAEITAAVRAHLDR